MQSSSTVSEPVVDLVSESERVCNEAAIAVVNGEPGARAALVTAEMFRGIALARRALEVSSRAVAR